MLSGTPAEVFDSCFLHCLVALVGSASVTVGDVLWVVAVAMSVVNVVSVMVVSVEVVVSVVFVVSAVSPLERAVGPVPVRRSLTMSCWTRNTKMMAQNLICGCQLGCFPHPVRHVIPGVVSRVPVVEVDSMKTMIRITYQDQTVVHRSASTVHFFPQRQ